jgi:hypothetical protein
VLYICSYKDKYIARFKNSRDIDIDNFLLNMLGFKTKNPKPTLDTDRYWTNIRNILSIPRTPKIVNKLNEFFDLFCQIFSELANYQVNRKDFFIRPSSKTKRVLIMLNGPSKEPSLKQTFINFLIDNKYNDGGTADSVDLNKYVEDTVAEREQIAMQMDQLRLDFAAIPDVPTSISKVSDKPKKVAKKTRQKVAILADE